MSLRALRSLALAAIPSLAACAATPGAPARAADRPAPRGPDDGAEPGLAAATEDERNADFGRDLFAVEGVLYRQKDNGGNPFVDEDAAIFETIILVRDQLDEQDAVTYRFLGDLISAASYDAFKDLATTSGATGINPGRVGVATGWERAAGDWTLGVEGSFDQEFAYRSFGLGAEAGRALNENNTRLKLRLQSYFDIVRVIRFDGSKESDEDRDTLTAELGLTQLLTPRSLLSVTLHRTDQDGFLATSFNSVIAGGSQEFEIVPDTRERESLTARYKRAVFDDDAVELGYRFYRDDWGIEAHTAELRYFHYLPAPELLLEPSYRYYDQSAADFFAVSFPAPQALQTSDPDLGSFTGHLFGVLARFLHTSAFGIEADWSVGANYYDRSDGLDLFWVSFGLERSW